MRTYIACNKKKKFKNIYYTVYVIHLRHKTGADFVMGGYDYGDHGDLSGLRYIKCARTLHVLIIKFFFFFFYSVV